MNLYYNANDRAAVGRDNLQVAGSSIMIGQTREYHEYPIILSCRA
jgi:hypothetical protein